jgi:hypothetical protein
LPTLVIAQSNIVRSFRKECSAADGCPRQSGWRSDRAHPEQAELPCSVIVVSTFIGPGWLPEQLGSLHKAGVDEDDEDYHGGGRYRYGQR